MCAYVCVICVYVCNVLLFSYFVMDDCCDYVCTLRIFLDISYEILTNALVFPHTKRIYRNKKKEH